MAPKIYRKSLRGWNSSASNTLVQGYNFHRRSGTAIGHNADNVTGQTQQDVVFHYWLADGKIKTVRVKKGGHGSSVGLEDVDGNTVRQWFGHDGLGTSGYVQTDIGESGIGAFKPMDLPEGDIEIDNTNDRLILRNGNRYRLYRFSSVRANKRVKLADFSVPHQGKRWQGMFLVEGHLFVHRDVETKGDSWATVFDLRDETKLPKTGGLIKLIKTINTSKMGHEAEGFHSELEGTTEIVFAVKRTGPEGPTRMLDFTEIYRVQQLNKPWDGKSFPGAAKFKLGTAGPWVSLLRSRILLHGYTGKVGTTDVFTAEDKSAVRWWQLSLGYTGDGADGYPGEKSWTAAMKNPAPKPPEVPAMKILSRSQWGAKPWAGTPHSVAMSEKRHFLVHYHGGPLGDQRGVEVPRLVEQIHRANGWSGPGYNFMVDMDGVAYEGRGWGLVGAHCPGRNRDGIGVYVAVGGDQIPTAAAIETVRALYAEANRRAGRTLEKCYHSKHYATSCPGEYLRGWVNDGMPASVVIPAPPVVEKPKPVDPPVVVTPPVVELEQYPLVIPAQARPIQTAKQAITTGFKVPGSWAWKKHPGHDWNRSDGEDRGLAALAVVEGTVIYAGNGGGWGDDYGAHVIIEDATGARTAHCHLNSVTIRNGAHVAAGTVIGTVGSSGNSSGPHVHIETRISPYGYGDNGVVVPRYDVIRPSTKVIRLQDLVIGKTSGSAYWAQRCLNAISLNGGLNSRLTAVWTADNVAEVKKLQVQRFGDVADGQLGPIQAKSMVKLSGLAGLIVVP